MKGCLQTLVPLKVQIVFTSLRFQWNWKIGKHGRLPASVGILISSD